MAAQHCSVLKVIKMVNNVKEIATRLFPLKAIFFCVFFVEMNFRTLLRIMRMKVKKGGLEENGLEQGIDVHIYRHPTCPCLTYETGFLLAQSPVNWSNDLCGKCLDSYK